MAFTSVSTLLLQLLLVVSLFHVSLAGRKLTELVENQSPLLKYHKGPLLSGNIAINLIWYGEFKPSQRAIISDFVQSLYPSKTQSQPSVSTWWKTTDKYYHLTSKKPTSLHLTMGRQILDENYSLGKTLSNQQLVLLAAKGDQSNAINVVLTASDVLVDGFCSSRCVAPNNDVGLDGMIINFASLLAGTATNPFGNGYYQGPADAPLEAASACPGIYGKNAYPGYAGDLLVDSSSGASYNANGANGRKYLLPALFDPSTSSCSTLV
ncbi:hypothetical protein IFM89_003726 [Coptis chinensis]|uniref:Uncharacterized protein n=1 Tax=Coptis chinensis TaxID=261450 RepID=A0A835LWU3_9MAGN|nr:hypothetical protein IFM89_003726 [Coptis chinensis]